MSGDAAELWFALLDQRCFTTTAGRWIAQVVGIHAVAADLWIQLASADEPLSSLLVRITPGMSLQDAIKAVYELIPCASTPVRARA